MNPGYSNLYSEASQKIVAFDLQGGFLFDHEGNSFGHGQTQLDADNGIFKSNAERGDAH